MSFFTEIPASLREKLHLLDGEAVRLSLRSDLDLAGDFGESWFVLTDRRVVAAEAGSIATDLHLVDVRELAVDELFGRSRLLASTSEGDRALVLYSANLVNEFATLVRVVNEFLNGHELKVPTDEVEAALCSGCGQPLPERGGHCPQCLPRRATLKRFAAILAPYRWRALALISITFFAVGMQMVPPLATKMITDGVLQAPGEIGRAARGNVLTFWILMMAGALVLVHLARLGSSWLNAWLGSRIVADLRNELHRKLQELSMSYHGKRESGELIGRVTHDTGQLQHFLIDGLPFFLVNIVSFLVIATILLVLDWRLALLVFLPVPLLLGGGNWFWRKLIPLFHKEGNRIGMLHTQLGESIRGVKTVKATAQEERRQRTFVNTNEGLRGVRFTLEATWFGFFETMALTMSIGTVGVWYLGSRRILDPASGMSLGDLVAFIGYMVLFYGPLQWFTAVLNWLTNAIACAQRIFSVIDHTHADVDRPGAEALTDRVRGEITFEDVRFSYERGKEVLKGVDLAIKPGEMIGLVGRSGSGKSTIINLICRFHDADSGRVLIDGKPLGDVTFESWRSQVGIVMQDPFLFNASILDNIRYSRPDASFEEVVAAARAACAHDFILDKDEGYDTVVGEGAVALSGGEKQRIAIARAVLMDPPVLILDEATSAVDSETERDIQEAIQRLVAGRTTIAIAHRLATLRNADRLVVIEDGRIVEQGSHEALMGDENSRFSRMVAMQLEINKIRSESHALDG